MYCIVKISDPKEDVMINVYSGFGNFQIKLIGSTFTTLPNGSVVEKLFTVVPEGLHALAFFCKTDKPRRIGSGLTAYLDDTPHVSSCLMLSWHDENGKLIIKDSIAMTPAELARFNRFVTAGAEIFVTDTNGKIVYLSNELSHEKPDPTWTYKFVSMDTILEYITKKLTLEELDDRATSEQEAVNELRELREDNQSLRHSMAVRANHIKELEKLIDKYDHLLCDIGDYRTGKNMNRWWWPLCTRKSVRLKLIGLTFE